MTTAIADDFAAIRARHDELARRREAVLHGNEVADAPPPGHPEAFLAGHADAEMLHAIFPDHQKAAAHAEAIELARGPDGSWSGTILGHPIDRCSLAAALDIARSLRAPSCR